jgi:hypothetical protein
MYYKDLSAMSYSQKGDPQQQEHSQCVGRNLMAKRFLGRLGALPAAA